MHQHIQHRVDRQTDIREYGENGPCGFLIGRHVVGNHVEDNEREDQGEGGTERLQGLLVVPYTVGEQVETPYLGEDDTGVGEHRGDEEESLVTDSCTTMKYVRCLRYPSRID